MSSARLTGANHLLQTKLPLTRTKQHKMTDIKVIGIDLGATNIRGAVVDGQSLSDIVSTRIHSDGTVEDVLGDIYHVIDALISPAIAGIGIGVPSVVEVPE